MITQNCKIPAPHRFSRPNNQSGAALVVALILLVALSLMAISSMNTATLDLIMAGNEQYRSQAFVAAEAGVEQALLDDTLYDTTTDSAEVTGTSGGVSFKYQVTRPNNGTVETAPSNNSFGTFGAVHFRIRSDGTSQRGTTTTVTQELYEVVKTSSDYDCLDTAGGCDLGT